MGRDKKRKRFAWSLVFCLVVFLFPAVQAQAYSGELVPMGNTVGIRLKMDGVMIVGLSSVETADGVRTPAADAGLMVGDIVTRIGDKTVTTAADFLTAVTDLSAEPVRLMVSRAEKDIAFTVVPAQNREGGYQLGLWLRDSVTGIGTMTYYDPDDGSYGALGHGINDTDTGSLFPVQNGEVTSAEIVDVIKGSGGNPGELCGKLHDEHIGSIEQNAERGIFGSYDTFVDSQALPVASESEILLGGASILANVEGTTVKEYDVEISRIYRDPSDSRTVMIRVTDPALLAATGGIVQGMSGSPILQNGKLVGAVTHVLLSDPTRGYGISIEKMRQAKETAAEAA